MHFREFTKIIRSFFARIGSTSIIDRSVNGVTDYEVEEFIAHSHFFRNFGSAEKTAASNDIGLLKLVKEVQLDGKLRLPACLQQREFTGEEVIAVSKMHNESVLLSKPLK